MTAISSANAEGPGLLPERTDSEDAMAGASQSASLLKLPLDDTPQAPRLRMNQLAEILRK
jgi:hypothetical protein